MPAFTPILVIAASVLFGTMPLPEAEADKQPIQTRVETLHLAKMMRLDAESLNAMGLSPSQAITALLRLEKSADERAELAGFERVLESASEEIVVARRVVRQLPTLANVKSLEQAKQQRAQAIAGRDRVVGQLASDMLDGLSSASLHAAVCAQDGYRERLAPALRVGIETKSQAAQLLRCLNREERSEARGETLDSASSTVLQQARTNADVAAAMSRVQSNAETTRVAILNWLYGA